LFLNSHFPDLLHIKFATCKVDDLQGKYKTQLNRFSSFHTNEKKFKQTQNQNDLVLFKKKFYLEYPKRLREIIFICLKQLVKKKFIDEHFSSQEC